MYKPVKHNISFCLLVVLGDVGFRLKIPESKTFKYFLGSYSGKTKSHGMVALAVQEIQNRSPKVWVRWSGLKHFLNGTTGLHSDYNFFFSTVGVEKMFSIIIIGHAHCGKKGLHPSCAQTASNPSLLFFAPDSTWHGGRKILKILFFDAKIQIFNNFSRKDLQQARRLAA